MDGCVLDNGGRGGLLLYASLLLATTKLSHSLPAPNTLTTRVPAAFEGSGGLDHCSLGALAHPPTLIFRPPHPSALQRTRPVHALEALSFALCICPSPCRNSALALSPACT
jgi:hypothetical protein